jgi:hypothetical protein
MIGYVFHHLVNRFHASAHGAHGLREVDRCHGLK